MTKSNKQEEPKLENKKAEEVLKVIKTKERNVSPGKTDKKNREVVMTAKGGVNIQDQFLNHLRRDRLTVAVHLLDGTEIHGQIKSFDNFCIQLESSGEILIYKHGISSITPSKQA